MWEPLCQRVTQRRAWNNPESSFRTYKSSCKGQFKIRMGRTMMCTLTTTALSLRARRQVSRLQRRLSILAEKRLAERSGRGERRVLARANTEPSSGNLYRYTRDHALAVRSGSNQSLNTSEGRLVVTALTRRETVIIQAGGTS